MQVNKRKSWENWIIQPLIIRVKEYGEESENDIQPDLYGKNMVGGDFENLTKWFANRGIKLKQDEKSQENFGLYCIRNYGGTYTMSEIKQLNKKFEEIWSKKYPSKV